MKKIVLAIGLLLAFAFPAKAIDVPEAVSLLENSVVAIVKNSQSVCTASKIGPSQFLTAKHCITNGSTLVMRSGRVLHVKSVLIAMQAKEGNRQEDWAVINIVETDDGLSPLNLSCSENPYLGQAVIYGGYPHPTQYAVGLGHITTTKPVLGGRNQLDYGMDVHASPGASGSPVLSIDTGQVIGILTEGIINERTGVFMVGFESIKGLDLCDAVYAAVNSKPVSPTADALEH